MKPLAICGLTVLLGLGCAGPAPVGTRSAAIIGGAMDPGDPAVVLLISYPPDQSTYYTCTASVIAPSVLVTAAHCVDAANHPDYVFGVFTGDDASAYATAAEFAAVLSPVASVQAYPGYVPTAPFFGDVGVVVMASPLSITPLPLRRDPLPPSLPGTPARIVGYGQTTYGVYNAVRYAADTTVASLDADLGDDDTLTVGDAQRHTCVGDSGGPALVDFDGVSTIVGVDSYTDTTGCTEPSHYRRVDYYIGFLDGYLPPPDLGGPADAALPAPDASAPVDAAEPPSPPSHHGGCAMAPAGGGTAPRTLLVLAVAALAIAYSRRPRRSSMR